MSLKPFSLKPLTKISSREAELLNAFQNFLPRIGFSDKLRRSLCDFVAHQLGVAFSFDLESVESVKIQERLRGRPPQGIYLVLGMAPIPQKAYLEIDPLLGFMAIDKTLGGEAQPPTTLRDLTEIEKGVLSYICLKVLSLIFERCGKSPRVHFRLEEVKTRLDDVVASIPPEAEAIELLFRLKMSRYAGYARLTLPSPLVYKSFLEASPIENEKDHEYRLARIKNFGFVPTSFWAELGRTTLRGADVHQLEVGDVVVLEKTGAYVDQGRLKGTVSVRLGAGQQGRIAADILAGSEAEPVRFKITAVESELGV